MNPVTIAARDGWELTMASVSLGGSYHRALFTLSGLAVTLHQAEMIIRWRPRQLLRDLARHGVTAASGDYRSIPCTLRLVLTSEEARDIGNGADPLAVLLPPYHARPLTLGELMA